ncbi:transglutaminase-like cysteine peptidase [Dongia rigui]|uniref:Transglutaminase-like cysteine peptidase n=1 Tax=Dongia rigui TaxID=940149 RepID=A0ABU5DXH2_9PROT|nr:transglutaminase-like cysteine peptidase [Dongia rigui]MDY0871639.1 transglutaminase-like cysteine peptidase [Dongia rigui]
MALLLGTVASLPLAEGRLYPSLFGSQEFQGPDLGKFPKWVSMLSRWRKGACEAPDCAVAAWDAITASLLGKDRAAQLRTVNAAFNQRRYVGDARNWGRDDYWETPYEFLARNGDCEDYAIAKFMALKAAGVPSSEMRIVAVRNMALGGEGHAVLVVYDGGTAYLLDNQIKDVVPADLVTAYQPVYSINDQAWWRHRNGQMPEIKPAQVLPASP